MFAIRCIVQLRGAWERVSNRKSERAGDQWLTDITGGWTGRRSSCSRSLPKNCLQQQPPRGERRERLCERGKVLERERREGRGAGALHKVWGVENGIVGRDGSTGTCYSRNS